VGTLQCPAQKRDGAQFQHRLRIVCRSVLCADSAAISLGPALVANLLCPTQERRRIHTNTSPNRKFLLFTLLPTWKTGRMIPGRRPLESTTPGDKPCCA
jgi:hypothetical protein